MKKMLSVIFAVLLVVGMPFSAFAKDADFPKFTDKDTTAVKQAFESGYTNKIVVVPTWSLSKVGKSVKVTAKVSLKDFDTDKLVFYNYNKTDNKTYKISEPSYSIDSDNKLTFTTDSNQGFVIVSNSKLVVKEKATSSTETKTNSSGNSSSKSGENATSQGTTVYVTKTGSKYHYANPCGRGTYIASTLSAAKKSGLEPCGKCVLK